MTAHSFRRLAGSSTISARDHMGSVLSLYRSAVLGNRKRLPIPPRGFRSVTPFPQRA